jgi:hypothetical protein
MTHDDFVQGVSAEDTDLVLTLMREVLVDVYQSPARVARAQANRQEREATKVRMAEMMAKGEKWHPALTPEAQKAFLQLMSATPTQATPSLPKETP